MKLNFAVVIDANLSQVWTAFDDDSNKERWQQNFHSYKPMSGQAGQTGAVAQLIFDENGKHIVLTETITERREKSFLAATYQSDYATTMIVNRFEAINNESTRWTAWCNFSFKGWMKFMSLFVAGKIKKRTDGDMQRFKLMVETDQAGASD